MSPHISNIDIQEIGRKIEWVGSSLGWSSGSSQATTQRAAVSLGESAGGPQQIENRRRSASEVYRMQTEREDMDRRLQIAERKIADHDEYLRRQFRNL